MHRKAREVELVRERREAQAVPILRRAVAAHVDVEPRFGRGDLHVEGLSRARQRLRERPRDHGRAVLQRGLGDGAMVDLDDMMAARAM